MELTKENQVKQRLILGEEVFVILETGNKVKLYYVHQEQAPFRTERVSVDLSIPARYETLDGIVDGLGDGWSIVG